MESERKSNTHLILAKDVIRKFDISYQTLNHYTNLGLLHNSARTGIRRLYDEEEVKQRLLRIRALQDRGFTLRLIAEMMRNDSTPSGKDG